MAANIIPARYADALLAETVAPPKKGYSHRHSCTKALSAMENKTSKSNDTLKNLFRAIKQSNAENFCKLAQRIEYLKDKPYTSHLNKFNII